MKDFKPMLASPVDLATLRYPVWASPKLDGIRATVVNGKLLSRHKKSIPNAFVRSVLEREEYEGFDGELIVGVPNDHDVYRNTVSGVMSEGGEPKFTFFVFDRIDMPDSPYAARHMAGLSENGKLFPTEVVKKLLNTLARNERELLDYESRCVDHGYEGLILRDPRAPYKFGRSTTKEGYLLKLKRFVDSEALVLGVVEEMHNGNEAKTNALGRTERSSAKAGKVGKGTMGALHVMDIHTGVEFHIGTGFTAADRQRTDWEKKLIVYKSFPIGVKDLPRHPVYKGVRDPRDIELSKAIRQRMKK